MDAKKALEVVVLGGTLIVSANSAFGATACSNGSATTIATGGFVKTAFAPKCSTNVDVDVLDGTASFAVKSVSRKGKSVYGGSTEGGGISLCSTFSGTAPTITAGNLGC